MLNYVKNNQNKLEINVIKVQWKIREQGTLKEAPKTITAALDV